ncbi:MAG: helicase-exonuclease AddAB subunit AddA [Mogibacterium sp.]|nr:helicase-exonuclease AddAB subunit AddA [Mogibacterium sp.]
MATGFTPEQTKAIETLDKSVLVSAAAGSGKTAVLVERIIRIIIEGKANVDEMLVVTFTNAAAAEMRLRLAAAIRKRMADHPEDAARMKDQLSRLYKAYISTIDSFALRVIKEFFHETDMEPSFAVADDTQCELMRNEALTELFEDGFVNDDLIEGGSFRGFLRLYSEERSDDSFMEGLIKAYNGLRTMPDYFEWAYKHAEELKVTPDTFEGSSLQRMMLADAKTTFGSVKKAFDSIEVLFDGAGIKEMFDDKLLVQAEAVREICSCLDEGRFDSAVIAAIENYPSTRLAAKKDQKEAYESIKKEVGDIRDSLKKEIGDFKKRYLMPDFEQRLSEMNATYGYMIYYLRLLEEFERRYDQKKRDKRLIDFADMEHIAAGILRNDEAADILRRRFKFIFVDEYQDTNNIQEHLIGRVSRSDNVFRVGDIKQSIYRFRQAEPAIFEDLYAKYTKGGYEDGEAIDLGRNFRTNDATIRYINHVFKNIMEGYDERAMLYTGLECPEEYDFIPEVHILTEEDGNTAEAAGDAGDEITEAVEDENIEDLTKEEAEAEYIAKLVRSLIGTEFYDTKINKVRKAQARDIVILFRAVKYRGDIMSRALAENAIDAHVEESDDYFDTVEIAVALSLFACIDNMKRDVPLISVLHSEVFSFSPDDLAEIRISHTRHLRETGSGGRRRAYCEAFSWYAEEGPEGLLKDRAKAARDKILVWRRLSRMLPLEDFVWDVLIDSGYYRMAGAMSDGARRQANLRSLADRAAEFSKESVATLSSFITFLDVLRSKGVSNGQAPMAGSDDDVVRISTIHKSKGLEYPFVIVGGLGHRFRYDNNEKKFSFDSQTGVGLPYVDPSRKYWSSTIIQRAINSKSRRDEYKEELRLLYVAMTRARNKLILVGCCKSEEDLAKFRTSPSCYLEAIRDVVKTGFNRYYISPLMLTRKTEYRSIHNDLIKALDRPLSAEEQNLYDEIDRRFSYRYPYEDLLTAKAKYSVSAVRLEENSRAEASQAEETETDEVSASKRDTEVVSLWSGNERKKRASASDIGIAYHRIMEFLDFRKAAGEGAGEYIAERAEFLHQHNAIDDDVYASLDLSKIETFFRSPLGRKAAEAEARGSLMREKPFTLKTERGGREMLVQGVIDCCFEEEGKMILIDYKSSFIKPGRQHEAEIERIKKEYRVQIELYSEAVLKGTGLEVSEAYLYLFMTGDAVSML